ncbi:MAG: hypothetical protein UY72_C0022G0008 [Candidatus Uhrbacteria bacterium GW2011_GWD2_52_7]|uniref:Uncharacterized protein n=1 Tax=Candidatus Uhrbacteria bacterium GW2011_GWD2_52_7 TaxID=1618989 RepID=A0A0G2ACH6_9BACT|nr:MAG: hypothetical protein UY72_C0022G0008 [Candidatus Uhrbacteria bacterium GW2011_GWD2_52_7]
MCEGFVFIAPFSGGIMILDISVVMLVVGYWGKDSSWESVAHLLRTSGAIIFLTAIGMLNAAYFMELALCVLF